MAEHTIINAMRENMPGECYAQRFINDPFGDGLRLLVCSQPRDHEGPHYDPRTARDWQHARRMETLPDISTWEPT